MSQSYSLQLGPSTWLDALIFRKPDNTASAMGKLTIREIVSEADDTGERVRRESVRYLNKTFDGLNEKEAWANLSAWVGEVLR